MRQLSLAFILALAACAPRVRKSVATPATEKGGPSQPPRKVEWVQQVKTLDRGLHAWRRLPRVVIPDRPDAERFVNQDLDAALDGGGYVETSTIPSVEELKQGEFMTECADTFASEDVIAFVCQSTSIGAHPYEDTNGLAYDLRADRVKRLASGDLFTEAGAAHLKAMVGARVRAYAAAQGIEPNEDIDRIDPLELHGDRLKVTFNRCRLSACINGSTVVELSCAEVRASLRNDAVWRCPT